jgi:two-component system, LuxR family, sensor kinase FixL
MSRLDAFLAYAESNRLVVCGMAAVLTAGIAWLDWSFFDISIGFLYLIPILLSAAALNSLQIAAFAAVCGLLTEALDPAQGLAGKTGWALLDGFNPLLWAPGTMGRLIVAVAGFAMTGFFVAELNHRRRMLTEHLAERDKHIQRRLEAERQLLILIETSPLAILTLNSRREVELANESARLMLGFEEEPLAGLHVEPYLPILSRMLQSYRDGANFRTNVECKGYRRNGDVFLANVWLSTYRTSNGPGLAAVVWDASENLRDREGAGLDSMMATSRVLVGALSHEIRNLASAAASAHAALSSVHETAQHENYQALGTLIRGLEKIASAGLQMASSSEHVVASLGTLLDETRIVIEPALHEAEIQLVWEVNGSLPLVQGDHHNLLQAFLNLARNSQQALEGRERRQVRVTAGVENDVAVVRFYDTGPGVAYPEELFQPFQPNAAHSGLGLYITRAILRSHGGGLRYEPQPVGSCFTVELWPADNTSED